MKGGRNRKGEGQKGGNREMREGEGMKVEGEDRSCFHKVTSSTKYSTAVAVSTLPLRWNPPIWPLGKVLAVSEPNGLTNSGVLQHLALGRYGTNV